MIMRQDVGPGMHFHPSLTFVGKAASQPQNEAPHSCPICKHLSWLKRLDRDKPFILLRASVNYMRK